MRILAATDAHADACRGLGDDLVRRPGDGMAVDPDHGDGRAQPDLLEDRDVRIAGDVDARTHPPRPPEPGFVERERGDAGAFGGVGRFVVVPAAVEGGVAVLVDQRRQHLREREHRIGHRAAGHAAVHRTVERADPHVEIGETAQRVGEPGRADRPVAGVGEEQDVGPEGFDVRLEEGGQRRRADLLLALDEHLHVARQFAGGAQPGPDRGDVRDRARLVVGGAAAEQPAVVLAGFERIARPARHVPGRLHVVVRVEQDGGRVGAVGPLADDVRETAVDAELAHVVEPGVAHEIGDRRRARVDVVEVLGVGADARDADQSLELALRGVEIVVRGCDRGVSVHARAEPTRKATRSSRKREAAAAPRTRGAPSCGPTPRGPSR